MAWQLKETIEKTAEEISVEFDTSQLGKYAFKKGANDCTGSWRAKAQTYPSPIFNKYGYQEFNVNGAYTSSSGASGETIATMTKFTWAGGSFYFNGSSSGKSYLKANSLIRVTDGADVHNDMLYDFLNTYFNKQ